MAGQSEMTVPIRAAAAAEVAPPRLRHRPCTQGLTHRARSFSPSLCATSVVTSSTPYSHAHPASFLLRLSICALRPCTTPAKLPVRSVHVFSGPGSGLHLLNRTARVKGTAMTATKDQRASYEQVVAVHIPHISQKSCETVI